jgi:signal transduction histidine kinase
MTDPNVPHGGRGATPQFGDAESCRTQTATANVDDGQPATDDSGAMSARVLPLSQEELLALLAHDVRSPLHTLGLSADLLQQQCSPGNAQAARYFDIIRQTLAQVDDLVSDVLNMSDAFESGIPFTCCSVYSAAAHALSEQSAYADESGVTLSLAMPDADCSVRTGEALLRRVLANLLTNAIRATPTGGRVRLEAQRVGGIVEIAIEDDGCGLSPGTLDQLLRGIRQYHGGAHGFGLAIVQRLLDRVGGSLHASSVEGRGSRFAVRLPIEGVTSGSDGSA